MAACERGASNIYLTDNVQQFGNRHFNYFVVGEKEAAMVECGVSGGVYSLSQQWDSLVSKPSVKYLLVSHAHFDHVCGIPALRNLFPQASLVASAEAKRVLGKSKVIQNFFAQDQKMSEVLQAEGLIPELPVLTPPDTIGVDMVITGGENIDLQGGLRLQVLDAQGHSPCGLAFYLPQDRVMFVADAGGFQIRDDFLFPIFFQSYEMYIETLYRLRGYPTRVLATPHERIWFDQDVEAFYDRAIRQAQNAFKDIRMMLDRGVSEAEMSGRLFARYYRDDLRIYTPENIRGCVELLIRRVKECL